MNTAAPFTIDPLEHAITRAAHHLPTLEETITNPRPCWAAIFNTQIGTDDPDRQPLFIRTRAAVRDDDPTVIDVTFHICEPVADEDARTVEQIGNTGLHLSWISAKRLILTAEKSISEGFDNDITRTIQRTPDLPEEFMDTDAVAAVFPTNTRLVNALHRFRANISRRVLARTYNVAGTTLTFTQLLHVHDNLWHVEPTIEDTQRLLEEAGAGPSVANLQAFLTELPNAAAQAQQMLKKSGFGIMQQRDQYLHIQALHTAPYLPTTGVIATIWEKLVIWAVGRNALHSATAQVRLTDRNYTIALALDLDSDHYPSKKEVLLQILQAVSATANTETEKEAAQVMIGRTTAVTGNSPELPTLAEIMSLGMQEARAAGSSDWLGRRGLTSIGQTFHLKFLLPAQQ